MIKGIKNGAVLQRDENDFCKAYLFIESNEPKTSLGKLTHIENNKWCLSEIKTGGPYELIIDNETYSDIYVGDLWILAGQSNMEGAGIVTNRDIEYEKNPNELVRAFYMDDTWNYAKSTLHQLWNCKDEYIKKNWINYRINSLWKVATPPNPQNVGVGPGLSFALKMFEITGVPQGVIAFGIGGSSMNEWNPENKIGDFYYASLLRRIKECGSNVRGMYWDQGEAETSNELAEKYTDGMKKLISELRRDVGFENMPVVINQIFKTHIGSMLENEEIHLLWSNIREQQRNLPKYIDNLDVVSTANAELDDLIHKSSDSQHNIGKDAALSMGNLIGFNTPSSIKFTKFEIIQNELKPFWCKLRAYYENVCGELQSNGTPYGFSISYDDKVNVFIPNKDVINLKPEKNYVTINLEASREMIEKATVWYALGNNFVATISDSEGRSIPAMGPIKVSDYLK